MTAPPIPRRTCPTPAPRLSRDEPPVLDLRSPLLGADGGDARAPRFERGVLGEGAAAAAERRPVDVGRQRMTECGDETFCTARLDQPAAFAVTADDRARGADLA